MSKAYRLTVIRSRAKALRMHAFFHAVAAAACAAPSFHPSPRATVLMVRAGLPCQR